MFYPLHSNDPKKHLVLQPNENAFVTFSGHDALVVLSGYLIATAAALLRLTHDVHLLAFGPRLRFGEYVLPSNEPSSSIMPSE